MGNAGHPPYSPGLAPCDVLGGFLEAEADVVT